MKFCALGKALNEALQGLASKIKNDHDHMAIIGSEGEALIVMTWEKFNELKAAADKPAQIIKDTKEHYVPYTPYPFRYYPTWYSTTSPAWTGRVTCTSNILGTSYTAYNEPKELVTGLGSSFNVHSFEVPAGTSVFPQGNETNWLDVTFQ